LKMHSYNTGILTKRLINKATSDSVWDLGNKVLYDLCAKHPAHKDAAVIIAKLILVGRTYAAALERRRKFLDYVGDRFYLEVVVPKISQSRIDGWLTQLNKIRTVDEHTSQTILEVHFKVMGLFENISGLEKRSLASKYLHFHFPELFYIYDKRAKNGLSKLSSILNSVDRNDYPFDKEYSKLFLKCLRLRKHIQENYRVFLTPRQIDKLLIFLANKS